MAAQQRTYYIIEKSTGDEQIKTWWNGEAFGVSELMAVRFYGFSDAWKILTTKTILPQPNSLYSIVPKLESVCS